MKKRNFNLFLMALCTISLGLFSASNPNDVEEPGEIDEGNTLKKRVTAGSQCTDFIKNNKKLAKVTRGRPKEGTNLKRNGKDKFFLSIGTDSVEVDTNNDFFPGALFDASIVANLKAKGQLVKFLNQEMVSEIARSTVQSTSTGEKKQSISQDRQAEDKPEAKKYKDMSLYEKTKILINQQLDKAIDPATKQQIDNENVSDEKKEELVKDILNQKTFQDSISSKSQGSVRGMKTIASYVSAKPGDKKVTLCMVNLWSEALQKKADAIATMDKSVLKGSKPGKPLSQQVADLQTEEGARKVFSKFGTFVVKDEYGDLSVISYAQAGCMNNCSQMSEESAFVEAELKADRAIIQFREEAIELQTNFDKESQASESRSTGEIDYYAQQNIEQRYAASARGNLRGAYTVDQAMYGHPINGQYTALVVRAWTPSSQDFAGEIQESLDKEPGQQEVDYDYESNDYEDGGSMGLDDDDF
jgi:hypothetical protein